MSPARRTTAAARRRAALRARLACVVALLSTFAALLALDRLGRPPAVGIKGLWVQARQGWVSAAAVFALAALAALAAAWLSARAAATTPRRRERLGGLRHLGRRGWAWGPAGLACAGVAGGGWLAWTRFSDRLIVIVDVIRAHGF